MKIGIITDIHFRGNNPSNRIDDYPKVLITKFIEALSIFKKEGCDLIIDAGDMLHSPIVSLTLCDEIIDIVNQQKINIYSLYGNHCLLNGHIENSKATTLSHMFKRCEYIKQLINIIDNNILINGYDYYYGIEEDIKRDGLFVHEFKNYIKIAVVHAMITPNKMMEKVSHIPYKELNTDYDVVILGHYHQPIGIQKINNGKTTIIAPGALGRLSIIDDYQPQVAIYDTENNEAKLIPIKAAKPYKDVFDLEAVEDKKDTELMISTFISELENMKANSDCSIEAIVQEIWTEKKFEQPVLKLILDKIGEYNESN